MDHDQRSFQWILSNGIVKQSRQELPDSTLSRRPSMSAIGQAPQHLRLGLEWQMKDAFQDRHSVLPIFVHDGARQSIG